MNLLIDQCLQVTYRALACILISLVITVGHAVGADLTVDADHAVQMKNILTRPLPVYTLSHKLQEKHLQHVAQWLAVNLDLKTGKLESDKKHQTQIFRLPKKQVRSFLLLETGVPVIPKEDSSYVWFKRTKDTITFFQESDRGAKHAAPRERAIEAAKSFLIKNKLIDPDMQSQLNSPIVINHKRSKRNKKNKTIEKEVMSTIVIFRQQIHNHEVFNAKQIIEIYPETGELLSYATVKWNYLKSDSAQHVPYISYSDLIKIINKKLGEDADKKTLVNIRLGYYPNGDLLVPAIAVTTKPVLKDRTISPIHTVMFIGLAKGYPVGNGVTSPAQPSHAK